MTWSGSAAGSAPFNSQAAVVGIRGTAGAVGISGAVGRVETSYLVCLVYLVSLVGRTGKSTKRTRETRQTRQTGQTGQTGQTRETSRIRAELAKIFRVDGEGQWQHQEQNEEDNPHGEPPKRVGRRPVDLLCSRNAWSPKTLVGRAQWEINQPPSLKRE